MDATENYDLFVQFDFLLELKASSIAKKKFIFEIF